MNRHVRAACAAALSLLVVSALTAKATARADQSAQIDVVSYNVLAPIWASPIWYPDDMDPSLLDTEPRRAAIDAYLASVAATG